MNFNKLVRHQLTIINGTSFECSICGIWKDAEDKEMYEGKPICEYCLKENFINKSSSLI